ncbi:MAG: hypothetical protein EP346_06605 [Bacteroidetes bacterium]|nr:MAG: hypothetical protein EP346_06605 [Bacteroidota bacterium]
MTINYQLTTSDFLEYQLYFSSKSELHKKKRFQSRIIVPIIYVFLGLFVARMEGYIRVGIVFTIIGIIWFAFYPLYSKWRYKRHFQKHVEENFKNRINQPIELEADESSLKAKDLISETTINGTELKELIETQKHFFIKLTNDSSLIVPKKSIENETEFIQSITDLGAEYINELNWKWK